ncbi:MAG: hypothetical protein KatS3mg100_630 [Candidatus Parcubacteria bacterium]|nr:MAG: hypothetical protein KatS3mg100_630 [Candidatus Parcubacteria bacterium]
MRQRYVRETTRQHAFARRRAGGWGAWRLALPCARVAIAVCAILGAPGLIASIGKTQASFSDAEQSPNNILRAASLDVAVQTQGALTEWVGAEPGGEATVEALMLLSPETTLMAPIALEWIQDAALSDPAACATLQLTASHNGAPAVTHPLSAPHIVLSSSAQGVWQLTADVPVSEALPIPVAHGERCVGALRASARDGFSDEETIPVDLAVRTVLLNEILPNPDPDASSPNNREWIELTNIGNASIDVAGWMISEMTNSGNEVFHTIKPLGEPAAPTDLIPVIGGTLLPPGGTVVLAFAGNQAFLNNAGDTVRLYDNQRRPIDAVAYTQSDAPQGKSIARFPDGIGGWWDPVPTPGLPNQPVPTDTPLAKRSLVIPSEEDPPVPKTTTLGFVRETSASSTPSLLIDGASAALKAVKPPFSVVASSSDPGASGEKGGSDGGDTASSTPPLLSTQEDPHLATTTPEVSQEAFPEQTSTFAPTQSGSNYLQTSLTEGEQNTHPPSSSPPSEPPAPLAPSGAQAPTNTPQRSEPQENTEETETPPQQAGGAGVRPEESEAQKSNTASRTSEDGSPKVQGEARSETDATNKITLEL